MYLTSTFGLNPTERLQSVSTVFNVDVCGSRGSCLIGIKGVDGVAKVGVGGGNP